MHNKLIVLIAIIIIIIRVYYNLLPGIVLVASLLIRELLHQEIDPLYKI